MIVPNEETQKRILETALQVWIEPEIRRRQEDGKSPKPFKLHAAQVILYADTRPHEVRLNDEVEAIGDMKLKKGITKGIGDPVFLHELEGVPTIRLPDSADPDCGHLTFILVGNRWHGRFDLRYNKGKASEFLDLAEDFFQTAAQALKSGHLRPAIDNLFSAAELAAKAFVIASLPGEVGAKTHGAVQSRFNMLARHGNVDSEHTKTFKALEQARNPARYLRGDLKANSDMVREWEANVLRLIAGVRQRIT